MCYMGRSSWLNFKSNTGIQCHQVMEAKFYVATQNQINTNYMHQIPATRFTYANNSFFPSVDDGFISVIDG